MSALAATVEELRNDREHGASWMARRAVETLLEVSKEPAESTDSLVDSLVKASRELSETRPGVGAIAGATGRIHCASGTALAAVTASVSANTAPASNAAPGWRLPPPRS